MNSFAQNVWRSTALGQRLAGVVLYAGRRSSQPAAPRRILVVKLDAIGDVVLASPFLRELKRSFPAASITLVVAPVVAPLVQLCPHVDRVLAFDRSVGVGESGARACVRALWFAFTKLAPRRFDLAVLPRWDWDGYLGYYVLCGAGARHLGAHARTLGTVRKSWLSRAETRHATVLDDATPQHEVQCNLRLLEALGGKAASDRLELWLSAEDRQAAAQWLENLGSSSAGPLVALGIGASLQARCWPAENFAGLGHWLVAEFNARVILLGSGEADQQRAAAILRHGAAGRMFSAVDRLNLRETAALLERCQLFAGNDSGPMHLAAAAGIPVLDICGLPEGAGALSNFSPLRFGPWGVPARVVRPASAGNSASLEPDDVRVLNIQAVSLATVRAAATELLAAAG